MIGIQENKITRIPLMEAVAMTKAVTTAIEAKDFDKAMSLRDPEFRESLQGFIATASLDQSQMLPPAQVGTRFSYLLIRMLISLTEDADRHYAVSIDPHASCSILIPSIVWVHLLVV